MKMEKRGKGREKREGRNKLIGEGEATRPRNKFKDKGERQW